MKTRKLLITALALAAMSSTAPTPSIAAADSKCNESHGLKYCALEAVSMTGRKVNVRKREVAVTAQLSFTNLSSAEMAVAFSKAPLQVSLGGVPVPLIWRTTDLAGMTRCKLEVEACLNKYGSSFTNIAPKQEVFVTIRFSGAFDASQLAAIATGQSPLLSGQLILVGAGSPHTTTVSLRGFKVINRMLP